MEQIRAFIAIELPEKLRKELSHIQSMIKKNTGISARWVDPYGIHLTLKFLGNITPDQVEKIKPVMEQSAAGINPFSLERTGMGVFPNLNRLQVIWVGLGGDTATLARLQKRLEENLKPLGFDPEARGFTPHLTLGRVRDRVPAETQQKLGQFIAGSGLENAMPFEVNSINLMRSQLSPQGAHYSKLHIVKLESTG